MGREESARAKVMRLNGRKKTLLRIVWVGVLLLVIAGSLAPASMLPLEAMDKVPLNDKAMHFLGYAVLAFLPAMHERRRTVALSVAGILILGVAIELVQGQMAGRCSEAADAVANGWGVLVGLLAGVRLRG